MRSHLLLNMNSSPFWNNKEYKDQAPKLNKHPSMFSNFINVGIRALGGGQALLFYDLACRAEKASSTPRGSMLRAQSLAKKEVGLNLLHQLTQGSSSGK